MSKLRGKIRHASRQSELSRWFAKNHDWFNKEIKETTVPNWTLIAEMLANEGVLDSKGNPPKPDAVRMAASRFLNAPNPPKPQAAQPAASPTPEPILPTLAAPQAEPEKSTPNYLELSKNIKSKRSLR